LNLSNFEPKSHKKILLFKNSKLRFSYGNNYNFGLDVSFPLSVNYNGSAFQLCSEYGKLTMQSTHLYYEYSLFYKLDPFDFKSSIDTKNNFYDLLLGYDYNNFNFGIGIVSKNLNFAPELALSYKDNFFFTFQGTSIECDLKFSNFNFRYFNNSYYLYTSINSWTFGLGYDKDIEFSVFKGFEYYLPFTLEIGYTDEFYWKLDSGYKDIDFGYNSLDNEIYVNINKNL
jgi:hypothetical protein